MTFKEGFRQFEQHLTRKKIKGRAVSEAYVRQVKYTFPRFPTLHDKLLTEIDARMIAHACGEMKPSAKNSFLRVLSALFSWSAEVPRQWMKENPARNVPKESVGGAEVETFSPDETARILDACIRTDETLLPYHVLGFFAGIRPEELERTLWEFINLDESVIVLPPGATKTGKRRVVKVSDTLAAWLRWIVARHGIQQGPIVSPVNLRKRLRAVREEAKVNWIQDGMRHTYASCWLAVHKDEHRLRENLGHRSAESCGSIITRLSRKGCQELLGNFAAGRDENRCVRVKPKQLFLPDGGRLFTEEASIVRSPDGTATVPAVRIDYKGYRAFEISFFRKRFEDSGHLPLRDVAFDVHGTIEAAIRVLLRTVRWKVVNHVAPADTPLLKLWSRRWREAYFDLFVIVYWEEWNTSGIRWDARNCFAQKESGEMSLGAMERDAFVQRCRRLGLKYHVCKKQA